jgi:hypothetical protein
MAIQAPQSRPHDADAGLQRGEGRCQGGKALRQSQRPWYKKKRCWAVGLLLIIIVAALGGGAGSDNSKPATSVNTSQDSQSEKPAAAY